MRWILLAVTVALSAPAWSHALAQGTLSETDRETARQLFQEGMDATRRAEWVRARDAFERLYALTSRVEILLNLATAQAQSWQLVEARESYRRFLAEASPELRTRHGASTEEALRSVEARLPYVVVEGLPIGAEVQVDGRTVAVRSGEAFAINPGSHTLVITTGAPFPQREELRLAEAERREIVCTVTTAPEPAVREEWPEPSEPRAELIAFDERPPPSDAPSPPQAGDDSLAIGLGVGAGVVVVAGAVVLAVVLVSSSAPSPFEGSLGRFESGGPYVGTLATW